MTSKFKMGEIVEVRGNVCGLARGERAKVVAILTDTAYRVASLIHLQDAGATDDDLCEPRWTELERARKHLANCQSMLSQSRAAFADRNSVIEVPKSFTGEIDALYEEREKNLKLHCLRDSEAVLAALSWVWDAQERELAPYRHLEMYNGLGYSRH